MAEEKPKEKIKATIIAMDTITLYDVAGNPVEYVVITYQVKGYPPRTIIIPKEQFDEKKLPEIIKVDFEKVRTQVPKEVEL